MPRAAGTLLRGWLKVVILLCDERARLLGPGESGEQRREARGELQGGTDGLDDPGIHIELQRHANEIRLSATGYSSADRLLMVVFAEVINGQEIRIISARKANRSDRKKYEQERET